MYIHLSSVSDSLQRIPELPCLCASFRRASRSLTQVYDEALRPSGLRATQFTILQALELTGETSQGQLGKILAMDSTTLTRTLRIMSRGGWIAERRGEDRRERLLSLSKAGRKQFNLALPLWEEAQAQLKSQAGQARWRDFMKLTREVTTLTAK
jgi:DNA-binding MarR family transcriptional regulator